MDIKKILVVDDDPGLRELLQEYLSSQGYEVQAVANGVEMEQFLQNNPVNLVILDLMMPDIINPENAIRIEPEIKIAHMAFQLFKCYLL